MKVLGLRLNAKKTVLSPAMRTTYLGMVWDSTTMQVRMSPAWIESILTAVTSVRVRDRHVLVCTENTAVVSYINHQGGLHPRPLYRLAYQILGWSQDKLLSLRAVHTPGHLNMGADILSRQGPRPGEWMLHPDGVKQSWRVFGQAEVDLFATQETAQCPLWYSLIHPAPLLRLYTLSPIALLPGLLARVRRDEVSLLLVAPFWPSMVLGPDFSP